MKKFIAVMFVVLFATTTAYAGDTGTYMGIGAGPAYNNMGNIEDQADMNMFVGKDFGNVRVEADYDYLKTDSLNGHLTSAVVLGEYTFGRFTPYAGVGVGYLSLGDTQAAKNDSDLAYVLVGGVAYTLTPSVDLVGQYRRIHSEAEVKGGNGGINKDFEVDALTMGARYSF